MAWRCNRDKARRATRIAAVIVADGDDETDVSSVPMLCSNGYSVFGWVSPGCLDQLFKPGLDQVFKPCLDQVFGPGVYTSS
jgi:hypothetical protein